MLEYSSLFRRIFKMLPQFGILLILLSLLSACSSAPTRDPAYSDSSYLATPESSVLLDYLEPQLSIHPSQTGVLPLAEGVDAFIARLALIRSAQSSIDLQYYIYRADETGKTLVWQLLEAAERGVRVRLLLDDTTSAPLESGLAALNHHPNIQVRLYNPVYSRTFRGLSWLFSFARLNHRMHNKSLTVDNMVSVVGGRNIGNEYFSANDELEFGDFDLLAIGKAVPAISDQFDLYWNAPLTIPLEQLLPKRLTREKLLQADAKMRQEQQAMQDHPYYQRLLQSQLITNMEQQQLDWYWGEAKVLFDPPDKLRSAEPESWMLADIGRFLSQVENNILIISPYFVPTAKGADALAQAVANGIEVTVVTNSLAATDVVAVHAGYKKYRRQLLEAGVSLYEVKADPDHKPSSWRGSSRTSLHAKTFVLDDKDVFVGSFNFDPRSAWINTEMGILLHQPELAEHMQRQLGGALLRNAYRLALEEDELVWHDDAKQEVFYNEPAAGFWRRLSADILSLLPIESQL